MPRDTKSKNLREVRHHRSDVIVAAERGIPDGTKSNRKERCSETEDDAEQGNRHEVIIVVQGFLLFVVWMVPTEVMEESDLGRRIAHRIQDEDRHDQKRKDLIGESCRVLDQSIHIEETGQQQVHGHPNSDPSIER